MVATDLISKEAVLKSINDMPDKISIEELFDRIIYLYKIEMGLAQSQLGQGVPIESIREKMKTWKPAK